MGVVILPRGKGLTGTQPIYVSGNVATLTEPLDTPQLKLDGISISKSSGTLKFLNYPIYMTLTVGAALTYFDTGGGGDISFSDGITTTRCGTIASSSYDADASPFNGEYLIDINADINITTTSNKIAYHYVYPKKLYKKATTELNKANNSMTIRYYNGVIGSYEEATPATFDSWGTEFTSTEYAYITSNTDENYVTQTGSVTNNTLIMDNVIKYSGITTTDKYIFPLSCIASTTGGGSGSTGTLSFDLRIWNFTNSSWDVIGNMSAGGDYGYYSGSHKGHRFGLKKLFVEDYILNGDIYISYKQSGSAANNSRSYTWRLGYFGLRFLNDFVNG